MHYKLPDPKPTLEFIDNLFSREDIPTDYLSDSWENGLEVKKPLLDLLRLSESNEYRAIMELPKTMDSIPHAKAFMEFALRVISTFEKKDINIIDFQYVQVGKQKVRFTKLLNIHWDNLKEFHDFTGYLDSVIKDIDWGREIMPTAKDITCSTFMNRWGNYTNNGQVVCVSGNPYDFLILADDSDYLCSYSSCLRYNGGEYFNSCLHYLASPSVLIGFTAKSRDTINRKTGRCILYIGDRDTVVTGRVYGDMTDISLVMMREYIFTNIQLQTSLGFDNDLVWVIRKDMNTGNIVTNNTSTYVDTGNGVVATLQGIENFSPVTLECGKCLSCGDVLDDNSGTGGVCDGCGGDRCRDCGNIVHRDDIYHVNGDIYCDSCYHDRYSYCDSCSEDVPVDEIVQVRFYEGHDSVRQTIYMCRDCASQDFYCCDDCGDWSDTEYSINGGAQCICPDCLYNGNFVTCSECGEIFTPRHTKSVNVSGSDEHFCIECYEKKLSSEIVAEVTGMLKETQDIIDLPALESEV